MTEIDVIMGMLDWNNSAEEQAAGLAQAAQVENFQDKNNPWNNKRLFAREAPSSAPIPGEVMR